MRSLTFLFALFFVSCGNTMLCAPSTCTGCCESANGRCLLGTDLAACGLNGSTCTACQTGDKCVRGGCQVSMRVCDSSTCDGCCDNGTCVSGQLATQCGSNGGSCNVCFANEQCVSVTGGARGGRCQ